MIRFCLLLLAFLFINNSAYSIPQISSFNLVDLESGKIIEGYSHIKSEIAISNELFEKYNVSIGVETKPKQAKRVDFNVKSGNSLSNLVFEQNIISKIKPFVLNQDGILYAGKKLSKYYQVTAVTCRNKKNCKRHGKYRSLIIKIINKKQENESNTDELVTPTPEVTPDNIPFIPVQDDYPIWANSGEDKVTQDELRLSRYGSNFVKNSIWNGTTINLFSAKNETVSFNLVVEAQKRELQNVKVSLNALKDVSGTEIVSNSKNDIFNYLDRQIEIFAVKYLQIKGLSLLGYDTYDERHIPTRLRRPHKEQIGSGTWQDRPDHDKFYPDIAVPQELVGELNIQQNSNQSFWVDIYVPKNVTHGLYSGNIVVTENNNVIKTIPVKLEVKDFTLPDTPNAKTMLYFGDNDLTKRYLGKDYPDNINEVEEMSLIRDRHFQMAHRHKISLIDSNPNGIGNKPEKAWERRLDGSLFTAENGYAGVGEGIGNGVFSIATYGAWSLNKTNNDNYILNKAAEWDDWFKANFPNVDYFLYLADESNDYSMLNKWAKLLNEANSLKSFATIAAPNAFNNVPYLDIACSTVGMGETTKWNNAANYFKNTNGKNLYFYNGQRPQSGSFMIDDDGVALRQVAWSQYKMGINRWFYWESTYYNNFQAGSGETNVFKQAQTFGLNAKNDVVLGETGWNYSNGDGVLFYPGTDKVYQTESYEVFGPIASLRLKHWRRGIQDVDYLSLAYAKNPKEVQEIVSNMIPKVLWEYGVSDVSDPTWILSDISWSTDPDKWEEARAKLADIIQNG